MSTNSIAKQAFEDAASRYFTKSFRAENWSGADTAAFRKFAEQQGLNDPEVLLAADESYISFALLDADNNGEVIGYTAIKFGNDSAEFGDSLIREDYQGNGLAHILYETRHAYLKDIGFEGDVVTYIAPENTPSIRAALKNGFYDTGRYSEAGTKRFHTLDGESGPKPRADDSAPGQSL